MLKQLSREQVQSAAIKEKQLNAAALSKWDQQHRRLQMSAALATAYRREAAYQAAQNQAWSASWATAGPQMGRKYSNTVNTSRSLKAEMKRQVRSLGALRCTLCVAHCFVSLLGYGCAILCIQNYSLAQSIRSARMQSGEVLAMRREVGSS